ncbi:MAG: DNA polymerase Y family protein [Spirochaetia bacterium]
MPRPACINLPELPLQILFRDKPQWKEVPAAVVASRRPLAQIEALNRPAAALGIRRGMRYATALSLSSQLRADVVSNEQRREVRTHVSRLLSGFSPEIEACSFDPEIFWVDTRGLLPLFSTRTEWAQQLKRRLSHAGFHANIAVGFSRFGTFAWAKRRKSVRVFETPQEENNATVETPLSHLPFPPQVLELIENLGLHTVGDFTALPVGEVRKRLGGEALEIYRFATDTENLPLQGAAAAEEPTVSLSPLAPIKNTEMLEHSIGQLLGELIENVSHRGESIRELYITLQFEGGTSHTERITPAHPTRNAGVFEKLIHLRLEHITTSAGVSHITLEASRVDVRYRQEQLFDSGANLVSESADKALATLRAELGNNVVSFAELFGEHLPEERFRFAPCSGVRPPRQEHPQEPHHPRRLVRRIRTEPLPMPQPAGNSLDGPFVISGHWWRKRETQRAYYYHYLPDGRVLWIYYDGSGKRWFQQGSVD